MVSADITTYTVACLELYPGGGTNLELALAGGVQVEGLKNYTPHFGGASQSFKVCPVMSDET